MARFLPEVIARPLVRLWLETSRFSWRRLMVANDSPHVHAPGTHPDRVLIAGDGAATGRGVLTHDLGLPGYLARSLSAHTGRAADVDIIVTADMTAVSCLVALAPEDLSRFDIVVLSLGANEALALSDPAEWRSDLAALLDHIEESCPSSTPVFLLSVPFFGINPHFPRALARVVDRHAQVLNRMTEQVIADRANASVLFVPQQNGFEPESSHVYRRWAEAIALRISATLDPARLRAGDTEAVDEARRQEALATLEVIHSGPDAVLDRLTETTRQAFGTAMAAVTFIQSDDQIMKSAAGIEPRVLPRNEAICDITIRRASHFVIEDARLDSRFSDYSVVSGDPGVRFYAGYPIEAPDGQRVGALCVMDSQPRRFTANDAELLRSLAQTIQAHLWQQSA